MDRRPTLEDLLGFRDGEPGDPGLAAQIAADPEAQAELDRLRRLEAEIARLPPVTPPAAVWEAIQERTGGRRPSWLQRFPLATAATVFLATALGIVLLDPVLSPQDEANGPQVQDPVAQLMLRSRSLESELFTRASAPTVGSTSSEQALLYGIADVDAQLNALYEAGSPDPVERERLWRQRVALLESLAEVQRGQAVLRPAIY